MNLHKTIEVTRTKIMRFYPFVFTGEVPCKEVRTPLNSITFNEERDEETCYGYCDDHQPHAVRRMFNYKNGMLYDLRWDDAGNLGQVSMSKPGEMFEAGRFLFWTEDCCGPRPCGANRMHTAVDDKYYSYYVYDHSGRSCASREQSQACLSYAEMEQRRRSQRRLKLTGKNELMDVNAEYMNASSVLNEPTLYPSAYMVLTNKGYTKHYYAGTDLCASREQSQACLSYAETKQSVRSNRVAARLGGGGLDAQQHVIAIDDELQWRADKLFKQSLDQVNHRVLGENDLDCIMRNRFARDEFGKRIDGIPYQVRSDVETDYWQFKDMIHSMLDDPNNGKEKEVYFYHSDHLGSANWITDYRGKAVQHIQYLPYGEPYINQRAAGTTYSERFRFTGKERDEETGFHYYGARYYWSEVLTGWLSVDPMADKYPSISPYAYCAWNPVKLVDPDGNEAFENDDIVLKGTNNSSVTVKTDLVDITVNVDYNFGGNYTLQGDEVVSATLDLAGIFDPSGICDGTNAALQIKNGEWGGAALSVAGLIPYVGDLAKIGKVSKDVKIIENAIIGLKKSPSNGLSNPFKGKTFEEIDGMFRAKGYEIKGPDPKNGKGSYLSPSGNAFYLDKGGNYKLGYEGPHVDATYNNHPSYDKCRFFLDNTPKSYKPKTR